MAANNDFNLVISDEEGTNPMSGRTQNTLSQHGSPAGQFTRQPHGDVYSQQYSYKNMTSPQSHDNVPSQYEHEYGVYHSDGQGPYYSEDGATHKTTSEYYSTVQPTSQSGVSTKAQFIKKSKRQPNESNTSEEEFQQQNMYGGTFSANSFQNDPQAREYLNRMAQGGNDRYAEGSFQNDPQAREYLGRAPNERYAEEYELDEEGQRELFAGDDPRSQSLRDSQLGGPVRYSKMSEEEAARAFENRRKELFSTYLKKGPKKAPGQKGLSAGNEAQTGNFRDIPSPEDSYGKGVGFVIYNDKSPTSSQPPSAQAKGQSLNDISSSKGPGQRRKPSIERRESPINTVKLAKQRKDSPSNRNGSRPGSQRQTPRSQKPAQPAQSKPVVNKKTPRDDKVTVDYKRQQSGSKRGDEYSGNQYENMATNESRQTQNRTVNVSHKNEQEYYGNNNPYLANKIDKKNKDILQDIHNLDEEIYRLESESTRKSQAANNSTQGYTQFEYMQQFEVNQVQNGQPQSRNSKQGWTDDGRKTGPRASEKENSYHVGQNVKEQREKRQRINELTAEKGMRYTDTSQQGSVKEQLQQSYMVLNEKGFEQHSDYLYERALVKMKSRDTIQEKNKEAKEREEMLQCTFSPQIKTKGDPRIEDIVTRTRNWQVERDRQMLVNERNKVEKELRECTFYPNGAIDKEVNAEFNPNGFYKRNIEWIKRKEAENKRRENEQYKSIMTVPEKSRSQANLSFSRMNESQNIPVHDRLASPMGSTRGGGSRLQRTPSNRSLRSARNEQRTGSEKRLGSARTTSKKRDDSIDKKSRGSYKRTTTQPNSAKKEEKKPVSVKVEKTFETQESVDNKKEVNMQSQILESYAILDGLQHLLHSKEKEKQENISKEKQGVTNKLKTISVPSKTATTKPDIKPQTAKSRYNPSPARSQPRLSAKLPVTSPGYQPQDTEEKMQSITVKKNRYFIEEKPMERRNSRTSYREQSASKDAKKRQMTPSKEYALTKYNKEGSYAAAANQAKKRGESPYKSKPVTNYDASGSKMSQSEAMVSPFHSVMASPQAYGLFGFTPSPRNQMNFVSKGLTSPNAPNLEKKYLSLLDQVSRVTKQLDHVSAENSTLQQDISSMQKRQMNKNMLYSQ